jgi:hypothetical protein
MNSARLLYVIVTDICLMKILGIPLIWILLLGSLIAPIGSLSAFATAGSSTVLTSSHNPSTFGQIVTFTATVSPNNATGIVQFNDTDTNPPTILGTSMVGNAGIAMFTTSSLSTGSHNVVAKYLGDVHNTASTSNVLQETINPIHLSSTIVLTSNTTSIASSQSVNFTAVVSPNNATGTVQFLINGTNFGSHTISSGKSKIVTSSLPIGTDIVSASYSGNGLLDPSSSNSVTVLVTTTVQNETHGKVTGGGHIGKNISFGFDVSTDSHGKKKIKGNIQYNDKTSKIKLHGNNVTSLFIDSSLTQASFNGNAIINGTSGFTFHVSITDPDKNGEHDVFSIMISDGSGNLVYQNSGQVKGHIEIHTVHNDDDTKHVKQVDEKNSHFTKSNEKGNNLQGKYKHKSKNHQD